MPELEDGELKFSIAASPFHPWNESSEAEIFGISTKRENTY